MKPMGALEALENEGMMMNGGGGTSRRSGYEVDPQTMSRSRVRPVDSWGESILRLVGTASDSNSADMGSPLRVRGAWCVVRWCDSWFSFQPWQVHSCKTDTTGITTWSGLVCQ